MTINNLVQIKNLKKHFPIKKGLLSRTVGNVKAVDGINITINKGETLGIVGESGSGKSTMGKSILQLLKPTEGEVFFEGENLVGMKRRNLIKIKREMQMVFQDPYSSLNPRLTVDKIITEPLKIHGIAKGVKAKEQAEELLETVGLSKSQSKRHIHEFSGGQRQRIGIARTLALKPKLVIADEPVSALDVSVQSQVINLMQDLQETFNLTYLFIAHDLSVVKHISDRVGVMYLGKIVELSDKKSFFDKPLHPYSEALMSAVPRIDPLSKKKKIILKGDVPSPANPPSGCSFHPRCPYAMEICKNKEPALNKVNGRYVACHLY